MDDEKCCLVCFDRTSFFTKISIRCGNAQNSNCFCMRCIRILSKTERNDRSLMKCPLCRELLIVRRHTPFWWIIASLLISLFVVHFSETRLGVENHRFSLVLMLFVSLTLILYKPPQTVECWHQASDLEYRIEQLIRKIITKLFG